MAIQAQIYQDSFRLRHGDYDYQMVNVGGFNNFGFQKQPQHPQISQHKKRRLWFGYENEQPVAFSPIMEGQILVENQRQEIDGLIYLQNERLKMALQEQMQQQMASIFKKYEERVEIILKQKDQEIAKAMNKNMELEELLRRTENENQMWEKMAKENENMVESLNTTIQELRESGHFIVRNAAEDAESCC